MEKKVIAQIGFFQAKPTVLNLKLLNDWVIWQFPKKTGSGFCGAVHPPHERYGWLPAVIHPEKNEAKIYGQLTETFETPELAADYCMANGSETKP